jgi:adenine/guanine phosphoribosyltransferase-like PRPP-binding protein/membrane-associated phospholipid phosphatase
LIVALFVNVVFFCIYTKTLCKDDDFFFNAKPGVIAISMVGNLLLFKFAVDDIVAYNLLCTYYYSWIVINFSAWLFKVYFLRDRPAAYYGETFMQQSIPRYEHNAIWKKMLLKSLQGKNARHSFPSLDSAIGGCVVGLMIELQRIPNNNLSNMDEFNTNMNNNVGQADNLLYIYKDGVFSACCIAFIMAMFGRVYLFAHHFIDVIVGGFIGFSFPVFIRLYFANQTTIDGLTSPYYLYGGICLAWLLVYITSLATFFFVPAYGLFQAIGFILLARLYLMEFSIITLIIFSSMLFALSRIFHVQAKKVKPWVVETMGEYFKEIEDPTRSWPMPLQKLLNEKRIEFLNDCNEEKEDGSDNIFPGDVYLSGKFIKTKYFACDWTVLKDLMLKRLNHFVESTGVNLKDIDLILGIYSGGALLAPIISDELNLPLEFIKAKRYKGLNLNLIEFGYVALQRALGQHDDAYKLSKLPDISKLKDKNILMIDDACVSGGTFKAVAKYCKENGCKEIRGLALAGSPSTSSHIWDPTMTKSPTIQKIDMPIFSPWGTF